MLRKLYAAAIAALCLALALGPAPAAAQVISSAPFLGALRGNTLTMTGGTRTLMSYDASSTDVNARLFQFTSAAAAGINLPGSARADTTYHFGYNVTGSGTRMDATDSALFTSYESHYLQGGAGTAAQEYHVQFVDLSGVTHRPLGAFLPKDGGAGSIVQIGAERIQFNDFNTNQKMLFDWLASTITLPQATTMALNFNGTAFLTQRNAANSAYINLPYLGTDDRLKVETSMAITGATPTTGTFANTFMRIGPSNIPNGGFGIAFAGPATTGAYSAAQWSGSPTGELSLVINNQDNASGTGNAVLRAQTAGASGGNPAVNWKIISGATWTAGLDVHDSSKWKLSASSSLGTSDRITIDTATVTLALHLAFTGTAPAVTSCGTSPTIVGSDNAGEVTTGTATPTACTITFNVAYTAQPYCTVVDRSALANLTSYTVSTTAIVLTTSAASSQKIVYRCVGA